MLDADWKLQEKYAIQLLTAPGENQFANAFAGDGAEGANFYLSSSNLSWWFISCEIAATPLN
jgi:hypothetical protein